MLLHAISEGLSGVSAPSDEQSTGRLVRWAASLAAAGIQQIHVREKSLSPGELAALSRRIVAAVRQTGAATQVILNAATAGAAEIALDCGADGVHFPASFDADRLHNGIERVRRLFGGREAFISVSCHSVAEIRTAKIAGADVALFAPVFEKPLGGASALPGRGLAALADACLAARQQTGPRPDMPVLGLGGVTIHNASSCVAAGAAGVAGIRLFLDENWRPLRNALGTASGSGPDDKLESDLHPAILAPPGAPR